MKIRKIIFYLFDLCVDVFNLFVLIIIWNIMIACEIDCLFIKKCDFFLIKNRKSNRIEMLRRILEFRFIKRADSFDILFSFTIEKITFHHNWFHYFRRSLFGMVNTVVITKDI